MISWIVPTYCPTAAHAEMVSKNLARLKELASVPTELVWVNNGSKVNPTVPADTAIIWFENKGISAGWNAGWKAASNEFLGIMSASVAVEPGWDTALIRCASQGHIAFPFTDMGEGFKMPDTAGLAGWCFVMPRSIQKRIGWFDESFSPSFYEDTDYWHRAWKLGIPLTPVESAHVTYQRRRTTGTLGNWELLFLAHRLKYSWKYGLDPNDAPPFYKREVQVCE